MKIGSVRVLLERGFQIGQSRLGEAERLELLTDPRLATTPHRTARLQDLITLLEKPGHIGLTAESHR